MITPHLKSTCPRCGKFWSIEEFIEQHCTECAAPVKTIETSEDQKEAA